MGIPDILLGHAGDAFKMIAASPPLFVAIVVAIGLCAWFLLRLRFQGVIDAQRERLTSLQAVASAAIRIDNIDQMDAAILRKELAELRVIIAQQTPRSLTSQQVRTITEALRGEPAPQSICIGVDSRNLEALQYAQQFKHALSDVNWPANVSSSEFAKLITGLVIRVKDSEVPPRPARHLARALTEAGIGHAMRSIGAEFVVSDDYIDFVVGNKLDH